MKISATYVKGRITLMVDGKSDESKTFSEMEEFYDCLKGIGVTDRDITTRFVSDLLMNEGRWLNLSHTNR